MKTCPSLHTKAISWFSNLAQALHLPMSLIISKPLTTLPTKLVTLFVETWLAINLNLITAACWPKRRHRLQIIESQI